jgi:phenylpropionate dioxygenase-like ring-hydroxylating dioxygenase large terminal subunit
MEVTIKYGSSTTTITDPYYVGRESGTDAVTVWREQDGEMETFEDAEILEVK